MGSQKGWPKHIEIGKCEMINQINHPKIGKFQEDLT